MSKDWSEEYYREPTKLELMQRERREFVKAYVVELASNPHVTHEIATKTAIGAWGDYNKQLTELEEKEQAE